MPGVVLYVSPFVPPAWIAAHGLTPRRVAVRAPRAAPPEGVCPFAWGFAEAVAAADPRSTAAAVFTSTCDQMRRAVELFPGRGPPRFCLHVPATVSASSQRYYRDELARLSRFLIRLGGSYGGTFNGDTVDGGTAAPGYGEPSGLDGPRAHPSSPRLALLGGPLRPDDRWLPDLIVSLGGTLALDATETGDRTRPPPIDPARLAADPLDALAAAYFAIPDVFRRPDTALMDYLARELAARHIQGIILVRHLWCDLWHALLVRLKERFGLPVIEIDLGGGGADELRPRARTRVESLLEALR